jgi:HK97 gp10 family phage protein
MARLISFNERALRELLATTEVQDHVRIAANAVASAAKRRAPKDTGAGAASIHAEKSGNGYLVSWDQAHAYMEYAELGTRTRRAKPFLRPAGIEVLGGR